MKIALTKRADYAIRATLALSAVPDGAALSVRNIATAHHIPASFLALVMRDLAGAGLVRAVAGRNGGYRLSRPPGEVSLLEVIEAIEGDSRRQGCVLRNAPCGQTDVCAVHAIFFAAQGGVLATLASATLADALAATGIGPR